MQQCVLKIDSPIRSFDFIHTESAHFLIAPGVNVRVRSKDMITDILLNCQLEKLPSNALCKSVQRSGEYLLQDFREITVSFFGI